MKHAKKVQKMVNLRSAAHGAAVEAARKEGGKASQRASSGGYTAPGSRNLRK